MEQVIIVDEANNEVGVLPRPEMRRRFVPHRATYIFVFRSDGALLVQHRTATKDVNPSYLDLCAGGVVTAGETYEVSAERELAEEMGIRGVTLKSHFDFWFEDGRVWGRVFTCTWDGEVIPQPEEVVRVEVIQPKQALNGSHPGPFTPDSLHALRLLQESLGYEL